MSLLTCQQAVADQEDLDTSITGTEGNDTINVVDPQNADASILSSIGEASTAGATIVESLGGNDTVDVATDIVADSVVNSGILSDPDESDNAATSTGINSAGGDDLVINSGTNTTTATSRAAYQAVLSVDLTSVELGNDEIDISMESAASSTGIDSGEGNDVVVNSSNTNSTAVSRTGGVTAGVPAGVDADTSDSVTTNAESIAKARASGVQSGAGDDQVTSSGPITADATATSGVISLNLAASDSGEPDKEVQSNVEASAKAEATSNGIDTDGDGTSSDSDLTARIVDGGLQIDRLSSETAVSGNDTVTNTNSIDSTTLATSDSTSVSLSVGASGSVKATLNAESTATSRGILTGGGNDDVVNGGAILAESSAIAIAAGTSVAAGQGGDMDATSKQKTESSTTVTATAGSIGIDAEGAAQSSEFMSSTTMGTSSISNTRTTRSIASTGSDVVRNTGTLTSTSTATVGTAERLVQVEAEGAASSDANSTATSNSMGINTGAGNDVVDNSGVITSDATSRGGALSITFTQGGTESESKADANVTAESSAAGIAADGNAIDVETTTSLDIGDGGLTFERMHLETAQHGDDDVTNTEKIDATATSNSSTVAGSASIDGAASTDITSTATSHAAAIDAGGGSDLVNNTAGVDGGLTATSNSNAGALAVGFAQATAEKAKPKVDVKASAAASSDAAGIAGDSGVDRMNTFSLDASTSGLTLSLNRDVTAQSGDDRIETTGAITAIADSDSGALGAAVTIDGAANAEVEATAESRAAAIRGGGGNDSITSFGGSLSAEATSTSAGVAVGVGVKAADKSKAKTKVAAETTAEARATGIAGDGGVDDSALAVDLQIDDTGIHASYAKSTTAATGDDDLTNNGDVASSATARTGAASVAVTIDGGASVDVDSTAKASARGLDSGGGLDTVDNFGTLTTTATATAATVAVSVSTKGTSSSTVGLLDGGTAANSSAIGISSGGDNHTSSTTITTDINFDDFGVVGSFEKIEDNVSGDGADIVTNSGTLTTTSDATTLALSVGVSGSGTALTLGRAKAESHAGGIESGNGDDIITNDGALISDAESDAAGANVSVTAKGLGVAGNAAWDGGTAASSTAMGIDADSGNIKTTRVDAEASLERAQVIYEDTEVAAAGDDTVTNTGAITSIANSDAGTLSVAVSPKGVAAAVSTSSAESNATGIRGGEGDDSIDNSGEITSTTEATAVTANVSVTTSGVTLAADAIWDSGTKAEATSTGIAGDGGDQSSTTRIAVGTDEMSFDKTSILSSGADTIDNAGNVTANATATAASLSVAVTASTGVAAATATSTAIASASAIDAGAGDDVDDVYNSGILNAAAVADAASASLSVTNVGLSVAADSVWDGGTTATATARGIDVGSGGEIIENDGEINSLADSFAGSVAAAVTVSGAAAATATATGAANSIAIDASAGDDVDTVINNGNLTSTADADAAALSVSFVNAGFAVSTGAVWEGGTGADAVSRGIDVGDGADDIDNFGNITAIADADAKEAAVSVAITGVAGAVATSTGTADAIAIDAGNDDAVDEVDNSGDLTVNSAATALTSTVSVTTTGVAVAIDAVWDGGTTADSSAKGIHTGEGADTIVNDGVLDIDSSATTASLAVGVAVTGAAGASATATGTSAATAIDAGSGVFDDSVINNGQLDSDATSLAAAASASFTSAGLAVGVNAFEGGTTADTTARGIQMGSGADSVENHGDIHTTADSTTVSAAVSVALSGVAGAVATSTSLSDASAIDTSGGADTDTVFNDAVIDATARSKAATATVAVTSAGLAVSADSIWDGGTTAESNARGIEVGDGGDTIENQGSVTSTAESTSLSASVSVAVTGVAGAIAKATADAESTAIAAGLDDSVDTVVNSGTVAAYSEADAASAAVAFTAAGVAGASGTPWDGGTTAESRSVAMQMGGGADTVMSDGEVIADSDASATGISAAVAIEGVAGAISAANAHADATSIDLGAGDDVVGSAGQITATSLANANSVSVAAVKFGVSAAGTNSWDGGTRGEATASGISAGAGADMIDNSANVDSTAEVLADAVSVSFTVGGVSAANSTASGDTRATAIDGGADNDRIDNLGDLTATAKTDAVAVSVAVTGIGVAGSTDAVWDGGTTTDASASGIDGGDGDDTIVSGVVAEGEPDPGLSTITAHADSSAVSVSTSVTVGGVSAAISTSTANGVAAGIDAGAGDDTVINNSDVTGKVTATSDSVTVAVSGIGGAVSGNPSWDGGTKANADTFGIAGGSGADELRNTNIVTADANADALSVAVAATVVGVTGASAVSKSTADAAGMSGDDGDDLLVNEGTVNSDATANANGVSVAVSGVGGAGSLSNNSNAEAVSTGLAGGQGIDTLVNMSGAMIDSTASAETKQLAVAATLWGLAVADTKADSTATGIALDGGADDDMLINEGSIMQTATADAKARSIAVTGFGGNVTSAGSVGHANSIGLAGDTGNDQLSNTGSVTLNSTATALGQSLSFTSGGGVIIADANADAIAEATGLGGDAGEDMLSNSGSLSAVSNATTTARSIGASLGPAVSLAKANSVATTDVAGMRGGDENDMLFNADSGVIDLLATANVNASSVSITVGGVANAEARTIANVLATGLSGGAGDDGIANEGDLAVNGTSRSSATGGSVNVAGTSSSKAGTEVDANAIGISGGAGADMIFNTGRVWVGPLADITADNWVTVDNAWMSVLSTNASSFGLVGAVGAESAAYARTESTGFGGGDADDLLSNDGELTVYATALSAASAGSLGIFGSSDATGGSGAFTIATGLSGDAGNDMIDSFGTLDVIAKSRLTQASTSFQFGGAGEAGSVLEAATDAIGISGGDGQDLIGADGVMRVSGRSELVSTSNSDAIFGSSDATAQLRGATRATGVDGGADDDTINNLSTGSIDVSASTQVNADSVTYAFTGGGGTSNVLNGVSTAKGFTGGAGDDRLTNEGFLKASADATLTATGGSKATFTGGSATDSTGRAAASSHAIGLEGGDGDDVVASLGTTVVEAKTTAESRNRASSSASFTSEGSSGSVSEAVANAIGLDGGAGVNTLVNEGNVIVSADSTAYAFSYSSGAKVSLSGDAKAFANSAAFATATGMSAADGGTNLMSVTAEDELISVTATAGTAKDLTTTLTVYRLQGNNDEDADVDEDDSIAESVTVLPDLEDTDVQMDYPPGTIVYCISSDCVVDSSVNSVGNHYVSMMETIDGDGDPMTDDPVDVFSWVVVDGVDNLPDLSDAVVRADFVDGQIIACKAESCRDNPEVAATATYWQVDVDPGADATDPADDIYTWVRLDGLVIEVNVDVTEDSFPTYAFANGNGLDGDGFATGSGRSEATAKGIVLGDGDNNVMSGNMKVEAFANTVVNIGSDGDVFGDSKAFVTSGTAVARAIGIELGNGNNSVLNAGNLSVTATPSAQTFSGVSAGGGVCIWFFGWWCGGEGTPDARASASFTADAIGIITGTGSDMIMNDGAIMVAARPDVAVDTRRSNDEYAARTSGDGSPVISITAHSTAIGIQTSDGDDTVTNNGSVEVAAYDLRSGCASADGCGIPGSAQRTLTAIGIQTGAGDDIVTNNGLVSAMTFANNVGTTGIGIDLGDGNDALALGGSSSVMGSIALGNGDDSLTLTGMPLAAESGAGVFTLSAGDGNDSLFFVDAGFFAGSLSNFENATKQGEGTYRLEQPLAMLDSLTIDGGTLELAAGDYSFSDMGSFSSYIHSDGDHGQLLVAGNVSVNGAITIEKRGDTYIADGTSYSLIAATSVDGSSDFTDVTLPESRPLLSFELQQSADSVDVVAVAASFSTVTSNPSYTKVADNLFSLTASASDDFSEQLGTLQGMDAEFDRAFASLSPESYEGLTSNTLSLGHQTTQLLRTHLGNARAVRRGSKPAYAAYEPVQLAYAGGELNTNGAAKAPFYMGQTGPIHADDPALSPSSGASGSSSSGRMAQTWASAFFANGDYDFTDGLTEYEHDAVGGTVGADYQFRDNLIAGFMISYAETEIDQLEAAAMADTLAWTGGLYATGYWDDVYVEGGIAFSQQTFKNWRVLNIGPEERVAASEHDGDTWMAFIGAGRELNFGTWHMEPYGTLYYFDIREDAFEETGADSLNLVFARKSTSALLGEVGTTFVRLQDVDSGLIDWHASIAYNHDFDIGDDDIAYSYAGEPDSFLLIDGRNITAGSAVLGAGLAYIRERSTLSLDYRGQFNSDYRNHIVGLRLAYAF